MFLYNFLIRTEKEFIKSNDEIYENGHFDEKYQNFTVDYVKNDI